MKFFTLVLLILALLLPVSAQDEEQALLEEWVDELASEIDDAAVTVQITVEDETWAAAAGLADGERAATPNDRFRIGSTSKTFLAVVALMLDEEGVLDLDAPAANYLPDEIVENIANAEVVTLRQLLAMRSGIPDYLETDGFWAAVAEAPTRAWTAAEALTYAYGLPASFQPDEDFEYSNSNYLLAQVVLESVTGDKLEALIRARILDPLGMDETYTQVFENLSGGFVNGYEDIDGDGTPENVADLNDGAGLGDGGLISTVGDLTLFYSALLVDESLLSEDALDQLLDFQDAGEDGGYSLGFSTWETEAGTAWGHSGAVTGFQSVALYVPDEDILVVILAASDQSDPEGWADEFLAEWME